MAFLQQLRRHGLRLAASGASLVVEPRAALTNEIRELIRNYKPDILRELAAEASNHSPISESHAGTVQGHDPVDSPLLAPRRRRVERLLVDNEALRIAWDASGPLTPESGEPVSVVLAVRTGVGVVSGELRVPRERFDAALFFRALQETDNPS